MIRHQDTKLKCSQITPHNLVIQDLNLLSVGLIDILHFILTAGTRRVAGAEAGAETGAGSGV